MGVPAANARTAPETLAATVFARLGIAPRALAAAVGDPESVLEGAR